MLTGTEIVRQINTGKIVIEPFNVKHVNPNSYDLTLNEKLLCYTRHSLDSVVLDVKRENRVHEQWIPVEGYVLYPHKLYLGTTNEITTTHSPYIPKIDGKSSLARLGISVHLTAGFGDVGFSGRWTLEITCIHPVRIYSRIPFCQISYVKAEGPCDNIYHGKYQNSQGVIASRSYLDFKEKDASFSPGPRPE